MKNLLISLGLFSILSCSNFQHLNRKIYEAQKAHLQQSSYEPTNRILSNIESQKKFRAKYFSKLLRNESFFNKELNDTLFILEDYFDTNLGASDKIQMLYQDTVYQIESASVYDSAGYKPQRELLNPDLKVKYGGFHKFYELVDIHNKIKNYQDWAANPLEYGYKGCLGGSHTLITAIYPDESIKVIYVRCWKPKVSVPHRNE